MLLPRRHLFAMAAGAVAASALPRVAVRARLSDAAGAHLRRFWRRRHAGSGVAPDRPVACRAARPAVRGREPHRRRRQSRHPGRRHRGAGRLYAVDLPFGERGQRHALRKARLQFPPRHGAGRGPGAAALVLLVNPSFPATTLADFIAYAKANPGKINMASPGIGTPMHVAGELFKMMTDVDIVHVPYRGPARAFADLLAGQMQAFIITVPARSAIVRTGKLRALAVTGATRSDVMAGHSGRGRIAARFRSDRLGRHLRARRTPADDHRQAQRHHHRRPCRSAAQGQDQGSGRRADADDARRVRQVPRRGCREVGARSSSSPRDQAELIEADATSAPTDFFIWPPAPRCCRRCLASRSADAYPSRPVRMFVGCHSRRRARRRRAAVRPVAGGAARAALRDREPARRRRQSRRRAGGARAARRLHAAGVLGVECDRHDAARYAQFRPGARHCAGRGPDRSADAADRQPVLPGQNAARVHRLCQSQSGQGQYRDAAGRQSAICQRRAAGNDDGNETCRHSLSRRSRRR